MLLKILYLLVRQLLSLAVLVFRGDRAKDAELLIVRHENAVLRRHVGRVRYEPADRVSFAALARLIPRTRWSRRRNTTRAGSVRLAGRGAALAGRAGGPGQAGGCAAQGMMPMLLAGIRSSSASVLRVEGA
ncbi:MAG: hypothetical protein ACLP5E_12255 [Streptosporangiaceae bacterium]